MKSERGDASEEKRKWTPKFMKREPAPIVAIYGTLFPRQSLLT